MAIWNLFIRVNTDEKTITDATNKIKKKFKDAWDVVEKDMSSSVDRGTKKMGNSFSALGKVMAGLFSIAAVTAFVRALFRAGSDLEETSSKFNQVFKGQEGANERFDKLAETIGRSSLQMKQFGSTTGAILKPLWFATEDALDLSVAITQLSIDIASFNNVSDAQANNALNRALTGEREALKSLGIAINETDIKNEYLRLWFSKTGEELTKQGKALATLSLLYKQTGDAQGDAIRTGDSWANQLKRFRGSVLDAFAQAWRQLSNDSASTLQTLNKYVVAYGGAFLTSIVKSTNLLISQMAKVASETAIAFNILSGNTSKSKSEQLSFIGAISQSWLIFATGIGWFIRWLQFLGQVVGSIFGFIHVSAGNVANALPTLFNLSVSAVVSLFKSLWPAVWWAVKNAVFNATEEIVWFINKVRTFVPGLSKLIDAVSNPFKKSSSSLDTSWFKAYFAELNYQRNLAGANIKALWEPFKNFSDDIVALDTQYQQASAQIQKDFNNSHLEWAKTQATIAQQVEKQKEDEKRTLEELVKKYRDVQNAGGQAGKWNAEASGLAKKAVESLKEETKKLQDSVKDLEKAQKDENDAVKKYHKDRVDELRAIGQGLADNIRKHEETIALIDKEKGKKIADTNADEQNRIAERYAEIQKEIADLQSGWDADSQVKINELLREKAIIQGTISQLVLDEAVRVSNLTEAERIQLEYATKRKEIEEEASNKKADADEELRKERAKLEEKQRITDYFMNLESINRAQIKKLEESEEFKKLDTEMQNEILRQAEERLKLEESKNLRIDLENQVSEEIVRLSNASTELQKANLGSLAKEYQKIIADINSAISRQRELNSLRSSKWPGFAQGGYTGDGWVNDVAGVVHRGEYVVPQHVLQRSPDLMGNLEAMRQGQNITNNKSVNFWGDVVLKTELDFDLFLEKQKFRL